VNKSNPVEICCLEILLNNEGFIVNPTHMGGDERKNPSLDSKHLSLIDTYVNAGNFKCVRYFALINCWKSIVCLIITLIDASKL
jgi:hypothetical protein